MTISKIPDLQITVWVIKVYFRFYSNIPKKYLFGSVGWMNPSSPPYNGKAFLNKMFQQNENRAGLTNVLNSYFLRQKYIFF